MEAKRMKQFLLAACLAILSAAGEAQNYHAIQGSSYAGALGVLNNPATAVNTPYTWDLVLLGAQVKSSTNAFSIHDYSYLSNPAGSLYHIDDGQYRRKANLNFNLNLLNTRIALNRKSSISFGANLRSYSNLQTSEFNYNDTLKGATDFLKINQGIGTASGKLLSSTWLEGYLSYARTLSDNEFGRLNAGITVKINKGVSGAYVNIENVGISQTAQNNSIAYTVTAADLIYGYSSNYDHWQKNNSTAQNIKNMYSFSEGGASFDAGIEYLVKPQGTSSFDAEDDYYDYDWKLGISLLDIGGSRYKYGTESRIINSVKGSTTGQTLDHTFDSTIRTVRQFNDSLSTLINGDQALGQFTVINPARLVVNVDHYLTGNYYLNAELSVNMPLSSIKKGYLQVKEVNLLTITPRWETKRFGLYLPIQFNNQSQFWIGAAFKAGPLLLGFHNLANLFAKTSTQNGGGYLALVFRAPSGGHDKTDKRLNCPKPVW